MERKSHLGVLFGPYSLVFPTCSSGRVVVPSSGAFRREGMIPREPLGALACTAFTITQEKVSTSCQP